MSELKTRVYRATLQAEARRLFLPAWTIHGDLFMGGEWLEGLVLHESAGDPRAYHVDKLNPELGESFQLDASYGLMQVEGRTALGQMNALDSWLAKPFPLDFLFFPLTGLAYGLRALATALAVAEGVVAPALAFYNGGGWGMQLDAQKRLNDQVYVELIYAAAVKVHADRG
jgi:hypothetical protein